jgi:hypothetical protein
MDIVAIFKEGIEVSKKNYIIFFPTVAVAVAMAVLALIVVGTGVVSVGLMGRGGMRSPGALMSLLGAMAGGFFVLGVAGTILGLVAHGMTVGMAKEALETGTTSLNSGFSIAVSRLGQLFVASVLVGIIVFIGLLLLFVPGLIASFFLMFTFVSVIVDNAGAVEAMKKSYATVRANMNDSVVFFIAMIAVGVVFAITNMVLGVIPVLGQLIGLALMGVFGGYASVVIVRVYMEMEKSADTRAGSPGPAH